MNLYNEEHMVHKTKVVVEVKLECSTLNVRGKFTLFCPTLSNSLEGF